MSEYSNWQHFLYNLKSIERKSNYQFIKILWYTKNLQSTDNTVYKGHLS